jgi:peptidoglycan/xylan/chitin deacetylase (PgdA/CDA1 family)
LSERTLFAIMLLEFGIVLPLLSAFSAPRATPISTAAPLAARLAMPTTSAQRVSARPTADAAPALDPPTTIVQQPVAVAETPAGSFDEPTAALPLQPIDMGLPAATLTNTPEPLPPVPGPADDSSQPVATLFPAPPAPAPGGDAAPDGQEGGPPPILMYHYIRYVDQVSDPLGYELSVTPELFEAHMAWLHEQGYTTMRMDAAARCIQGEARCPARAVALTFDDGYEDAFTTALPVLQRYGFTATFYIISAPVGQPGYMSWEQIATLHAAGMEIGAHTIDHFDLTTLDAAESERQIAQSKADLEHHLGISVVSFCYPTGLYNGMIEEQTRAAGYMSATTTRWDGDYSDMMALPRRRIAGETGVDGFAAIVQGY